MHSMNKLSGWLCHWFEHKAVVARTIRKYFFKKTDPCLHFLDISFLKENIISELKVTSWMDCSNSCLETHFCVAYNYKQSPPKENKTNCQLSSSFQHRFEKVSTEDNDWSFYETLLSEGEVGKIKSIYSL